jgi:hypothetical protein
LKRILFIYLLNNKIFEKESRSIEKLIPRLILCNLLIDDYEAVLFFLMRFYHNCLVQNKINDGCVNFNNFLVDERFIKKLKNLNVK